MKKYEKDLTLSLQSLLIRRKKYKFMKTFFVNIIQLQFIDSFILQGYL